MDNESVDAFNIISAKYQEELNKAGNKEETYNVLIAALHEVATSLFPILLQAALTDGNKSEFYHAMQQKTLELLSFYAIQLVRIDTNYNSIVVFEKLASKCNDPIIKKKLDRYCDQLMARCSQANPQDLRSLPEKSKNLWPLQRSYFVFGFFVLLVILAINSKIQFVKHEPLQVNPQSVKFQEQENHHGNSHATESVYDNPHVAEVFDYYDINGTSEIELRRQMEVNGYLWEDGIRYAGMTFCNIRWMTYTRMNEELCVVDKVDVYADIKFRMPRWSNSYSAPPDVQSWWTSYYDGLLKHENGHRDLGVETAREIQRKIADVPPQKTCKELFETADNAGKLALERNKQLNRDYDALTKHGLDQEAAYR